MLVAGIMSGTSVDGIDVALVEIQGEGFQQSVEPRAFHSIPYEPAVREAIFSVTNTEAHVGRLSQVHFLLGRVYGQAVRDACRQSGIALTELELIGSHGQTVYHQPAASETGGQPVASTLQIGEPALIAELTGAPVVADFRPADMAAGGEGAPLVPYVDYLLLRDRSRGRVALNIGGIANVTAIPPGGEPEQVIAFDTGPGNMIMDALAQRFSQGRSKFDRDGRRGARALRGSEDENRRGHRLRRRHPEPGAGATATGRARPRTASDVRRARHRQRRERSHRLRHPGLRKLPRTARQPTVRDRGPASLRPGESLPTAGSRPVEGIGSRPVAGG